MRKEITSYKDLEELGNQLAVIAEQGEALSLALSCEDNLENLLPRTISSNLHLVNSLFKQLKDGFGQVQLVGVKESLR